MNSAASHNEIPPEHPPLELSHTPAWALAMHAARLLVWDCGVLVHDVIEPTIRDSLTKGILESARNAEGSLSDLLSKAEALYERNHEQRQPRAAKLLNILHNTVQRADQLTYGDVFTPPTAGPMSFMRHHSQDQSLWRSGSQPADRDHGIHYLPQLNTVANFVPLATPTWRFDSLLKTQLDLAYYEDSRIDLRADRQQLTWLDHTGLYGNIEQVSASHTRVFGALCGQAMPGSELESTTDPEIYAQQIGPISLLKFLSNEPLSLGAFHHNRVVASVPSKQQASKFVTGIDTASTRPTLLFSPSILSNRTLLRASYGTYRFDGHLQAGDTDFIGAIVTPQFKNRIIQWLDSQPDEVPSLPGRPAKSYLLANSDDTQAALEQMRQSQ